MWLAEWVSATLKIKTNKILRALQSLPTFTAFLPSCYSFENTAERFTDLGKLNLPMVVWVWLKSIFTTAQLPQKTTLASKVVKINHLASLI